MNIGLAVIILLIIMFTPLLDLIVIALVDRCPKWVRGEAEKDETDRIFAESEISEVVGNEGGDENKDS